MMATTVVTAKVTVVMIGSYGGRGDVVRMDGWQLGRLGDVNLVRKAPGKFDTSKT